MTTSIIPAQLQAIAALIQSNTLAREFHDPLYPKLLYRGEAKRMLWQARMGERLIETRAGLYGVNARPITPGVDPLPVNQAFEQWEVIAAKYGLSADTNMAVDLAAVSSLFTETTNALGLNAGQTINQAVRNKLFRAYLGGHTVADTGGSVTSFRVASINGFTERLQNNQLQPVSASNPMPFFRNGTLQTNTIIGATPDSTSEPDGPGTLTLSATTTIAADDAIVSADAAAIVRSGGGTSVDALATTDILKMADIRKAVATLRKNSVPPHEDGYYHCHLDPDAESQLFADTEFQNLNQSNYGDAPYQEFAVGRVLNTIFYSNNESPSGLNTGTQITSRPNGAVNARLGADIGGETVNEGGVNILRTIITGRGAVYEKYVDEFKYVTSAGIQGKVGNFVVSNNSIQIELEGIRYIARAPQDRFQEMVSQSWSFSGDWGVPSDYLGGAGGARYKRAVVIESGQS